MKNQVIKPLVILGLIMGLLIPIQIVKSMVDERKERQRDVYNEIGNRWGSPVTFGGIFIVSDNEIITAKSADIQCEMITETRRKGIFKVPCYNIDINIVALFEPGAMTGKNSSVNFNLLHYGDVEINQLIINDKVSELKNKTIEANRTRSSYEIITLDTKNKIETISVNFTMRGSEAIAFIDQAENTTVQLSADWSDPNFTGKLPLKRDITQNWFSAKWISTSDTLLLKDTSINESDEDCFGVSLFVPISIYQQTDRILKYALLFIFLTFSLFFAFEHIYVLKIHPFQYLLVGAALTVFYMLLLALSEHIKFGSAYLAASLSVVLLISFYCRSVLKQKFRALLIALFLSILYSFLFVLIQMQQFTLLVGSIGIFLLLVAAMFFTRNIDWYALHEKIQS
ncbi:MAG: cell envelope integrity protein CreD [Spirochaetes bacterium]|nr:cell envelope integrity protein CreD [Spirochaetota bacterium]MBN2770729.1 cell envelope integrity protein CreD [Spirochaetota bacterium]